jgi:hypothetical protein
MGAVPTQFDWAGGSNINDEGAADIEFLDLDVHGLSVKAETGITLANLTPKALGLEVERGNDIFFQYAGAEYNTMKEAIFNAVLDIAEQSPGQSMGWHRETPEKYSITYNGGPVQQPVAQQPAQQKPDELAAVKKNAGLQKQPQPSPAKNNTNLNGPDFTSTSSRQQLPADSMYEDTKAAVGTFTITGKRNFTGTRQQVLAAIGKNAPWQRVFGDWFQANYATQKQLATPLYQAVAEVFRTTIVDHLSKDRKLDAILRMGKNPYFYCNAEDIYYVPSVDEVSDLQVKKVYYGAISSDGDVKEAEGTSQKFQAEVGRPGSEQNAKILIYIRYANGMFEANPTVRVQDLKDAEFLGWEKL